MDQLENNIHDCKFRINQSFSILNTCYQVLYNKLGSIKFKFPENIKNQLIRDSYHLYLNVLHSALQTEFRKNYNSFFTCSSLAHHARMLLEHATLLKHLIEKKEEEILSYIRKRGGIFEYCHINDFNNNRKNQDKIEHYDNLEELFEYFNKENSSSTVNGRKNLDRKFLGESLENLIEEELLSSNLIKKYATPINKKHAKWIPKFLHEAVHGEIYLIAFNTKISKNNSCEYSDSLPVLTIVHYSLYYLIISVDIYNNLFNKILDYELFLNFNMKLREKLEKLNITDSVNKNETVI